MSFINYLLKLRESFVSDQKEFWNAEIMKANHQLPGFNFNLQGLPWLYSGKLFQLSKGNIIPIEGIQEKLFYITINPKDNNDHVNRWAQVESVKSFINAQNNYFEVGKRHQTYGRIETTMRMAFQLSRNINISYPNLNRHGVIFDLIPFHSIQSPTPNACTYIKERWDNIFNLLDEIDPRRRLVIIHGLTALNYIRVHTESIQILEEVNGLNIPENCHLFNYRNFLILMTPGITWRGFEPGELTIIRNFITGLINTI